MMKIQYASDLHLEFKENVDWFLENPIIPTGDILVLAGDIAYLGTELYSEHPFWDWCSRNFDQTIVVPGNHELYRSFDINELCDGWTLDIRENVKVYYNSVISLGGETDLIASTLWAHIPPSEAYFTEHGVADFRAIRDGDHRLSWNRFNDEHNKCVEFIRKSVEYSNARTNIVVTHHVPSFDLMAEEFKGSLINGAFTSDLNALMESLPIDYWIYGHSHRNIDRHKPGFRQPAGFSDLYLTCLLIIHLGENAQCVFKHFFTVGYHDKIKLIDIYLPKIGHYLEIQVRNTVKSSTLEHKPTASA